MEEKMKVMPPFTHIKTLEDGNYGCTLLVADRIFNGVFTPDWKCIEKLDLVEVDAYADYDYKLKEGLIPIFDKDELDIVYNDAEELARALILNFENKDTYIDEEVTPLALFISQYEDTNGNIAKTLENTLLPYQYFVSPFLDNFFWKLYFCGCGRMWSGCKLCWNRVKTKFGIDLIGNDNPFDTALKQVIDEYQTFDNAVFDIVDAKYPDVGVVDSEFDKYFCEELEKIENEFKLRLYDGEYDFCYYGYLQYLNDNCKENFMGKN